MKTIRLTESQLNRIVAETLRRIIEQEEDGDGQIEKREKIEWAKPGEWKVSDNVELDYNGIKGCVKSEYGDTICFTFPKGLADEVWSSVEDEMDERDYAFESLEDGRDHEVLKFQKRGRNHEIIW